MLLLLTSSKRHSLLATSHDLCPVKTWLLAVGLSVALLPHDFFISILTIRHKPETRTLDLTWRITAHDIEHALENVVALNLGATNEYPKADSVLNAYFHDHLSMSTNGAPLGWNWIGKELDGETLYCYLEVSDVDNFTDLTLSNSLLQDLFYEQQNLVHLEREGVATRSHTFILGAAAHTFSW